jgi:hypothetical protein
VHRVESRRTAAGAGVGVETELEGVEGEGVPDIRVPAVASALASARVPSRTVCDAGWRLTTPSWRWIESPRNGGGGCCCDVSWTCEKRRVPEGSGRRSEPGARPACRPYASRRPGCHHIPKPPSKGRLCRRRTGILSWTRPTLSSLTSRRMRPSRAGDGSSCTMCLYVLVHCLLSPGEG